MFVTQTIALVSILIGIPFFGAKHSRRSEPVDAVPPVWKTVSMLAVENQFVLAALPDLTPEGPAGFQIRQDPRRLRVSFDPDSAAVSWATEFGEVPVGLPLRKPMSLYSHDLTWQNFRREWAARSRNSINSLGSAGGQVQRPVGGLTFEFPSPLPNQLQRLLGPGGPALRVSGSESIRLSGQSNWTNQQVGPLGQQQSLFPSLDMQQDLNIRLEGQLSDRIKVNMLQNSAVSIPLANRIAINYKGDEDDLVQTLDLGNTNLSLPGTQYVSYSGKNEGLFGVKATTRLGPLDLTVLASKQEGKSERASYAGGGSKRQQTLRDLEYVRGVYFLLYDPNGTTYEVPDTSIRVYLDDSNYGNNVNTIRGRALVDPTSQGGEFADTVSVRGTYDLLNPGADRDYEIQNDIYGTNRKVIQLRRPVSGDQRLAVTYLRRRAGTADPYEAVGGVDLLDEDGISARRMKLLRPPVNRLKQDFATGNYDDTDPITRVRELELKNFYQLPGLRIDRNTLKISIRQGVDDPPVTVAKTLDGTAVPYIEVMGLDNYDESGGSAVRGHDQRVDGTFVSSSIRAFVDFENGTLFFLDPRPFAPRLGPSGKPFENGISNLLNRRATLTGPSGSDTEPNPLIYDKYNLQRDLDAYYYIDVEFTAAGASGEVVLGRGNLLEGSEVVTINGEQLVRDQDYSVDYDLGRITLKRQLAASDQLNVDYSFAPIFAQASRTLLGSAFRIEGRERSLGGAFMFESKGAQDLRPRLGEEPSRSLIGDVNADWMFRPDFLTRLVDKLPGVRTTTPSELRIQAEVGASFPNPNTRNEVYIDDMEGVRDAVSLNMNAERWQLSSVPSRAEVVSGGRAIVTKTMLELEDQLERVRNAELKWYSPHAVVKEVDLKPTLSIAQGADNPRQVLALSVPRRPVTADSNPATLDSLWAGLTYSLDRSGLDLSRSQFVEVWVNDFNDLHDALHPGPRVRGRHVRMHVDLGVVSEDQMRAPNRRPNRMLDSEDLEPRDGQLVVTSQTNEDTGYDGLPNASESDSPDLVTVLAGDPAGDDFREPDGAFKEIDPRRFRYTNGTENNKTIRPVPDTEDLNVDNNLDIQEDYYEYTIDLGDDDHPYLVVDLQKQFAGLAGDNGWRRYRIPIADTLRVQFGAPDLTLARHVRVWFEGITRPDPAADSLGSEPQRPLMMLGSLDIVGSRWRSADLDTAAVARGATVTLNSVNSIDNADIYQPPFDPGETRSGSQSLTRREQSLALEFTELPPGHSIEAFKTFSLDEDYSRYGKLSWFVTGFEVSDAMGVRDADSLAYFIRFSSDEQNRNYYEFRSPLPSSAVLRGLSWQDVGLELTEISNLKLDPDFQVGVVDTPFVRPRPSNPADTLIIKGRPSFTRLRRISVGLLNRSTGKVFRSGQLWFNELRATDIAKDVGTAQRILVNGRLANLMSYNMSWNGRNADFLSVGQSRGSGFTTNDLRFGTTVELHRFIEGTGITLPVSFSYGENRSSPRFSAGDDVIRIGALAEQSESSTNSRAWTASYSRVWTERSNPLLRYTIGGITANFNAQSTNTTNPNAVNSERNIGAGVNYDLAPRRLLQIPIPLTKLTFFPLPERFFWNYRVDRRENRGSDRQRVGEDLIPRAAVIGRAANIRFGADTRPFEFFHHRFDAYRNLMIDNPETIGFINFGRVVTWNQSMDTRYNMNLGPWLSPNFSWNSRYSQDNRPEISRDLSIRAIGNGQTLDMRWQLPFDRLSSRRTAADTARASGPMVHLRNLLMRLGGVSSNANFQWNSTYSRLTGVPSFLYLVGLAGDPGVGSRMEADPSNQVTKSFNWGTGAQSRVSLFYGASMQTRFDYNTQLSDRNGVERRRDVKRFPDLQVDYGNVAKTVRLDRFLRNPRLRTVYNRSQTVDYNNGRDLKSSIATSSQWQPMLGLTGDLQNGARLEVSLERRITQREDFQLGSSVTTDRNTDLNVSLSRSYSQGQKVSFLGRESTVRSSVSLGLTAVYSRTSGETVRSIDPRPQFPVERDRLSINGRASYGFSSNVTGDVNLGFGQERDLQRDIVRRNVRVELRGRFTF